MSTPQRTDEVLSGSLLVVEEPLLPHIGVDGDHLADQDPSSSVTDARAVVADDATQPCEQVDR